MKRYRAGAPVTLGPRGTAADGAFAEQHGLRFSEVTAEFEETAKRAAVFSKGLEGGVFSSVV